MIKIFLNPATFYWSASTKPEKWAVIYLCVKVIDFFSFYDFDILFWSCSESVVFFVFILLALYICLLYPRKGPGWLNELGRWI